ncbi:MAG TPA: terminase family protein, partial [Allosphingosinicella sp.]|nr:terminase family protein [Allosphingosinicella sp.]
MASPDRRLPPDLDLVAYFRSLSPERRRRAVAMLGAAEIDAFDRAWPDWAHRGQAEPPGDWRSWVMMAGRGFGKTLAGAKWITAAVATGEKLSIALVGATLDDARRVMVEGRSGLIEVAGAWIAEWRPSLRRLRFRTGAEATLFSGASPDSLRGPEHHLAWCDELAKWEKPGECWAMLQLGLRLGQRPRALVTTTPRPGPVLKGIMAEPGTRVTGGSTRANPHLPSAYKSRVEALYAGTRLGRQELDGELLADTPGALWTVELIEKCRIGDEVRPHSVRPEPVEGPPFSRDAGREQGRASTGSPRTAVGASPAETFSRVVIGVDPPSGDGTCGIVACAKDREGRGHVLADHSVTGRSPEGWARAVAGAAGVHGAGLVVAEANQGGRMVESVLRAAGVGARVRLVRAADSKAARADPV